MMRVLTFFTVLLMLCSSYTLANDAKNSNVTFYNSKPASKKLPFSEMVKVNDTIYLSGQIGFDSKSGKLAEGGFAAEAHQTLSNIKQTIESHGYTMQHVVKCMVMLTNIKDFAEFNRIYTQYFTPPYPVRSAFAVSELALDAKLEVECMAAVQK